MARLLGEAYIAILPDTTGFGSKARAEIDKDMAAIHPEAKVGAQLSKADIAKIGAQLKAVSKANPVNVGADLSKADIAKIGAQLKAVGKNTNVDVGVNLNQAAAARVTAQLDAYMKGHTAEVNAVLSAADLAKIQGTLDSFLKGHDTDVGVKLNPAQLAKVQGTFDAFVKELNSQEISPDWNILPALTKMGTLKSANASLRAFVQQQNAINFDISGALRQIAEVKKAEHSIVGLPFTQMALSQHTGVVPGNINVGSGPSSNIAALSATQSVLSRISQSVSRVSQAFMGLTKTENDNADAVTSSNRGYGLWGRAIGILQAKIPLFGGALMALHFPDWIAQASGIHIMTEAVIETLGVWIPAAIAATAFGLAGYKAGKEVYTQIVSMNQVMNATGAQFKGMTSQANSLSNAVRPQVYQLFGDYLLVAGHNSGALATALKDIGNGLDKIGAKVVQLAGNGGGFAKFLQGGSKDLDLLIAAFGELGRIIDVFLRSVPGYAEILLKLGTGVLTVTANVLGAIQPVIKWGLAIHGAVFYLGLASTAIIAFGRGALSAGTTVLATGEKLENTGSKVQGLGIAFGNMAGKITASVKGVSQTLVDFYKILNGSATALGVGSGIDAVGASLTKLTSEGKITTQGVSVLEEALAGLRGAGTDAAGIEVLNAAIAKLGTASEDTAAVSALKDALGGMGKGGLAEAGEGAAGGVGKFSQIVGKLPGFSADAEKGVSVFGTALTDLPLGPVGIAVGVLAAGLGVGLFLAFHKSTNAATLLNQQLERTIAASSLIDVQQNIAAAIQKTTLAIQGNVQQLKQFGSVGKQAMDGVANPKTRGALQDLANNYRTNEQNLKGLTAQQITTNSRVGDLTHTYGGLNSAQELVTLSGINQADVTKAGTAAWAKDMVQIRATAAAYGFMGQQAGAAGNQLDTLLLSQKAQTKDVQALTSAEAQFLATITGGVTAFTTFEQGQATLSSDLNAGSGAAVKLTTSSGKLTQQQKLVKTAMDGTSTSALAAQQAFASQITSAGTLYGNLQTLSAATNNTKTSQVALGHAGKDLVAQLLPMAAGSKTATAEVYALAQVVGYTGPDSFSKMSQWLGKTKGAESDLGRQTGILTQSAAGLQRDMQLLAGTMSGQVNSAMASAIFFANGGQKAFNNLALALKTLNNDQTPQHFAAVERALKPVAAQLVATVGPGQAAENMFIVLAAKMGISNKEAAALWQSLQSGQDAQNNLAKDTARLSSSFSALATGPLKMTQAAATAVWDAIKQQDLDSVSGKADNAKSSFINFARNGLNLTNTAAGALWTQFHQQGLDTLAAKAGTTKASFVNLAHNGLGITTTQASELWNQLRLQYLDTLATKANTSKASFVALAEKGLGLTQSSANTLWGTLRQQYLDTLATKAGETEGAFVKVARQFGLTKSAADLLFGSLHGLAGGSPYTVAVEETLSGKGSITAKISAAAITLGGVGVIAPQNAKAAGSVISQAKNQDAIHPVKAAAGTWISGNHSNGDSVHVMAKPGELIVPTEMAPAVAGHMAANGYKVPGYAAGGVVGFTEGAKAVASNAAAGAQGIEADVESFAKLTSAAFGQAVTNQFNQEQATANAAAFGGASGSGIANATAAMKYLATNLFSGNLRAAAGAVASVFGESNWNPESVNCVPLTYKVVTTRGILSHDEVKVGDVTPTWNPLTRTVEDAEILAVPYHANARMCRIGNDHWSAVCTWDHKWIIKNGGLMYAGYLLLGQDEIQLASDRFERIDYFEDMGEMDNTFCLTTTTGTWTTIADDDDRPIWTGNTSGFGLIGWTGNTLGLPGGRAGALTGNATKDFDTQLEGIIGFVKASGDMGTIAEMISAANSGASITTLAELWGKGVERYGIDDVHGAGVSEATSILGGINAGRKTTNAGTPTQTTTAGNGEITTNAGTYAKGGIVGGGGKILALGASTTQGVGSTKGHNYTSDLERMLGGGFSVENAGISGNELTKNSKNGVAGATRFKDLLKGVKAAVIWEGNNDISAGVSASKIIKNYQQMISEAHEDGVKVVGATLQPAGFSGKKAAIQEAVNKWIMSSHTGFDSVANINGALADKNDPNKMASWVYNKGQKHGEHPGNAGYLEMAKLVDSALGSVLPSGGRGKSPSKMPGASSPWDVSLSTLRHQFDKGDLDAHQKHLWHLMHEGTKYGSAMPAHGGRRPHSAGGMISEPVYGFGANSGIPYSFAENGPEMISPASNSGGTDNFMQPMTQSQGQQLIQLLRTLTQQGQQLPQNLSNVQRSGLNAGMRRGAFTTGG